MAAERFLLVLGELLSDDQKELLIKDACSGLLTCPSNSLEVLNSHLSELNTIQHDASASDYTLTHSGDGFNFSVLYRPTLFGLSTTLSKILAPEKNPDVFVNVNVIYAGLLSDGSGHWILPNHIFTPMMLTNQIQSVIAAYSKLHETELQPAGKPIRLHIGLGGLPSGGEWRQLAMTKFENIEGHSFSVTINRFSPTTKPKNNPAGDTPTSPPTMSTDFVTAISNMVSKLPDPYCPHTKEPLKMRAATEPKLQITKPCMYVFPEGSGQASILCLPGYSMLVNGGCAHRPCFWGVANYLNRLDSVLLTHWGVDNLLGIQSVLPVVYDPNSSESSLCFLTPPPKPANPTSTSANASSNLLINLSTHVSNLMNQLKQLGLTVNHYPMSRGAKFNTPPKSVQLYQKVGQGSLELFALTPTDEDSAELRRLTEDWTKAGPSLMTTTVSLNKTPPASKSTVPLLSYTSVSALVVWKPARETEPILRFLFVSPNAHQTRILLSLESLTTSSIYLRHAKAVPAEFERKRPPTVMKRPTTVSKAPGHVTNGTNASAAKTPSTNTSRPSNMHTSKDTTNARPPAMRPATGPKKTDSGSKKPAVSQSSKLPAKSNAKPQTPSHESSHPVPPPAAATAVADAITANTVEAVSPVPVETASSKASSHASPLHQPLETPTPDESVPMNGNGACDENGHNGLEEDHPSSPIPGDMHSESGDEEPSSPNDLNNLKMSDQLEGKIHGMKLDYNVTELEDNTHLDTESYTKDPVADWGAPEGLPPPPPPPARRVTSTTNLAAGTKPNRYSMAPRASITHLAGSQTSGPTVPAYAMASAHASGPGLTKTAPYDKVKPIYVDVAFLPGGGNPLFVDIEWFKRVRARFYIVTDPMPSATLLEALALAKETWTGEDASLSVSLVLAQESQDVLAWMSKNISRLNDLHVDITSFMSKSFIQLIDGQSALANGTAASGLQTSANSPGYRIDF